MISIYRDTLVRLRVGSLSLRDSMRIVIFTRRTEWYELGYRRLVAGNVYIDLAAFYQPLRRSFQRDITGAPYIETNPAPTHVLLPAELAMDSSAPLSEERSRQSGKLPTVGDCEPLTPSCRWN